MPPSAMCVFFWDRAPPPGRSTARDGVPCAPSLPAPYSSSCCASNSAPHDACATPLLPLPPPSPPPWRAPPAPSGPCTAPSLSSAAPPSASPEALPRPVLASPSPPSSSARRRASSSPQPWRPPASSPSARCRPPLPDGAPTSRAASSKGGASPESDAAPSRPMKRSGKDALRMLSLGMSRPAPPRPMERGGEDALRMLSPGMRDPTGAGASLAPSAALRSVCTSCHAAPLVGTHTAAPRRVPGEGLAPSARRA